MYIHKFNHIEAENHFRESMRHQIFQSVFDKIMSTEKGDGSIPFYVFQLDFWFGFKEWLKKQDFYKQADAYDDPDDVLKVTRARLDRSLENCIENRKLVNPVSGELSEGTSSIEDVYSVFAADLRKYLLEVYPN